MGGKPDSSQAMCNGTVKARYWAHSLSDQDPSKWHPLPGHLAQVATLARDFASAFGAGDWGHLAGLWHDIGKYQPEFQEKLRGLPHQVDHSIVGALLARSRDARLALPLMFAIAGHHGGLPNPVSTDSGGTPLQERLAKNAAVLERLEKQIPTSIAQHPLPQLPSFLLAEGELALAERLRATEFWMRFVYSALVDADFLDTEAFCRPGRRAEVLAAHDDIPELRRRLDQHMTAVTKAADSRPVNRLRADVLAACRATAVRAPGAYSLSVPTGGGKTLSSMAFGLRHAEAHGLRRVVVVIPYTSIIEQNAAVYREVFGARNVIEHHSNLDPAKNTDENRLASENWDAPIIVTTSVQFFESLFANRPSRCRRLHNIARSVVVLDEVQCLPSGFLEPILEGLRELVCHYGTTVLLSTATQPALRRREALPQGFADVAEIIPDPARLARRLSRVNIEWPHVDAPCVEWEDLAGQITRHEQVLAVVHRRRDARVLAQALPEEGCFHLSALMCPRHRSAVLQAVRRRLAEGRRCRVVSTQLIEAGVDVDFPVVYRALAGLDSVVQAAGRCNREGKLDKGRVIVFRAPTQPPVGTLRKALESTESMLRQGATPLDLDAPGAFEEYFRRLYFKLDKDTRGIQRERQDLNFANTAAKFRVIDDVGQPVIVPYEGAAERLDACRRELTRQNLRALQAFVVNVYPQDLGRLEQAGALESEPVCSIAGPFRHLYTERYGLVVGKSPRPDASELIV